MSWATVAAIYGAWASVMWLVFDKNVGPGPNPEPNYMNLWGLLMHTQLGMVFASYAKIPSFVGEGMDRVIRIVMFLSVPGIAMIEHWTNFWVTQGVSMEMQDKIGSVLVPIAFLDTIALIACIF